MAIRQWTIVTRTKTEEMWRKSSFGYFLVIIAVGFAVLWYFRVPPPGYSVTAMGVAAGVMALRAEMSGREKWLWTLILFAFALVEIRAISHDRTVHDKEQAETRAHEAQSFSLIGTGIQQSIEESQRHFDATMQRIERTVGNTESRAILTFQSLDPVPPARSLSVKVGDKLTFNIAFTNTGNEDAADLVRGGKIYIAKPDDIKVQKQLAAAFDTWWDTSIATFKPTGPAPSVPPQYPAVFTISSQPLTASDLKQLTDRTATIYALLRFVYSDHNGRWVGDVCFGLQEAMHDFILSHSCMVHDRPRYRAGRSKRGF